MLAGALLLVFGLCLMMGSCAAAGDDASNTLLGIGAVGSAAGLATCLCSSLVHWWCAGAGKGTGSC